MQVTATERVLKACHLAHPVDRPLKLGGIQLEPSHQGGSQPFPSRALQVFTVGSHKGLRTIRQSIGDRLKRLHPLAIAALPQIHCGQAHSSGPLQQLRRWHWDFVHA